MKEIFYTHIIYIIRHTFRNLTFLLFIIHNSHFCINFYFYEQLQ